MSAHARLGPSAADRWMVCPGSTRLIERLEAEGIIPRDRSSGAADEGTAAHQVRADALELGLDAADFIGTSLTINGVEYVCDDDMAMHLQIGIDWLREQPGDLIVEHRVALDRWMAGQFGTLDSAVVQREQRRLVIDDLKYGSGVPVDAAFNRQLRIYALGIVDNFDLYDVIDDVWIVIDQPRAGGLKFWDLKLDELLAFGKEVAAAARRVDEPDAPLVASEKGCKWCPVKDTENGCPAYTAWMNEIADHYLDDLEDLERPPSLTDPLLITPEKRGWIVRHSHLVTAWLGKLYQDSLAAAEAGNPDPGMKRVLGRKGNRRYIDEAQAETLLVQHLGDDAYAPRVILSPAEAEKRFKPGRKKPGNPTALAALGKLVTQSEGKPILVPIEDEAPAIPSLVDALDDLDDLL